VVKLRSVFVHGDLSKWPLVREVTGSIIAEADKSHYTEFDSVLRLGKITARKRRKRGKRLNATIAKTVKLFREFESPLP
jgi:hypothetical protein